jgi:hypothetical protein
MCTSRYMLSSYFSLCEARQWAPRFKHKIMMKWKVVSTWGVIYGARCLLRALSVFTMNINVILNILDRHWFIMLHYDYEKESHTLLSPQDQLRYFPASVVACKATQLPLCRFDEEQEMRQRWSDLKDPAHTPYLHLIRRPYVVHEATHSRAGRSLSGWWRVPVNAGLPTLWASDQIRREAASRLENRPRTGTASSEGDIRHELAEVHRGYTHH